MRAAVVLGPRDSLVSLPKDPEEIKDSAFQTLSQHTVVLIGNVRGTNNLFSIKFGNSILKDVCQAQGAINQAFYLYRIGTAMTNLS